MSQCLVHDLQSAHWEMQQAGINYNDSISDLELEYDMQDEGSPNWVLDEVCQVDGDVGKFVPPDVACKVTCKKNYIGSPNSKVFRCVEIDVTHSEWQMDDGPLVCELRRTDDCECDPLDFKPVCASHDIPFRNECFARCNGHAKFRTGPCESYDCAEQCQGKGEPVCVHGTLTDQQFDNSCLAECQGEKEFTLGACPYNPSKIVLGLLGVTSAIGAAYAGVSGFL